ncbi:MAG: hypothetical protein JWN44_3483 [Myxococcales bacterium]|nr:hypothetical protein [Myxococcales bacterium]
MFTSCAYSNGRAGGRYAPVGPHACPIWKGRGWGSRARTPVARRLAPIAGRANSRRGTTKRRGVMTAVASGSAHGLDRDEWYSSSMLAVVLSVTMGLVSIDVEGECPTREEIAAALEPLLQDTRNASTERVQIRSTGSGVGIQFINAVGVVTGKRWLAAGPDCGERARSAAVIIAAQRLQLTAGAALPPPDAAGPPGAVAPQAMMVRRAAPPQQPRAGYDLSAAFVSAIANDGGVAPGASIAAILGRAGGRFGGHVALSGTGQRSIVLGTGQARWTRLALSLGAAYRIRAGHWIADMTADAVAALLLVGGNGFAENAAVANFDPGLAAGIRAGYRWHRLMPFLGVGITGWLRSETVSANALAVRADLPRLDVILLAGASFGDF